MEEAAKVELNHFNSKISGKKLVAQMSPNAPFRWNEFSFTLSSISVPPTPLLDTPFVTDNNQSALWDLHVVPAMYCSNSSAAGSLKCDVSEDCACYAAETKANCKCTSIGIASWFRRLQYRLETSIMMDDEVCTIPNTILTGCYNCVKQAHCKLQ